MLNESIGDLKDAGKVVAAGPETSVAEAAALMHADGGGAVAVVADGALVGIFTESDIVSRVTVTGRDPRSVRLAEVMTHKPLTIGPQAKLGQALLLMHERGIRHLPVVDGGRLVGMVRARDALDPELEDFTSEQRRRESFR